MPGPPYNLQFSEITMSSLRVSWEPPKLRNGKIVGYIVTYETAEQNERKDQLGYRDHLSHTDPLLSVCRFSVLSLFEGFSKQVKQKVTETSLLIQSLEEEVTYTFMVRAETIDFGPPVSGNVTTGPQEGSPMAPTNLAVTKTVSSVELQWTNGASGKGPILGYYVETRRKGEYLFYIVIRIIFVINYTLIYIYIYFFLNIFLVNLSRTGTCCDIYNILYASYRNRNSTYMSITTSKHMLCFLQS